MSIWYRIMAVYNCQYSRPAFAGFIVQCCNRISHHYFSLLYLPEQWRRFSCINTRKVFPDHGVWSSDRFVFAPFAGHSHSISLCGTYFRILIALFPFVSSSEQELSKHSDTTLIRRSRCITICLLGSLAIARLWNVKLFSAGCIAVFLSSVSRVSAVYKRRVIQS